MSWYDTLAAIALWTRTDNSYYNDGDMIYNGQVIHRDQYLWDHDILSYRYFLFPDSDCDKHGDYIADITNNWMKTNGKGKGYKSLPRLLKRIDDGKQ